MKNLARYLVYLFLAGTIVTHVYVEYYVDEEKGGIQKGNCVQYVYGEELGTVVATGLHETDAVIVKFDGLPNTKYNAYELRRCK